ncbi:hypothetical protein [Sporosarcina sp. Marseille-Q4943]|uniref:hypothetical protein n=1 Tax=Sporosarcina sp. Marseille-Q4943 TaxID=2942204 RepID=UPI00208DB591|nr:hypothetical protein [Sporosarcina sp. Marseille-Q4943]
MSGYRSLLESNRKSRELLEEKLESKLLDDAAATIRFSRLSNSGTVYVNGEPVGEVEITFDNW